MSRSRPDASSTWRVLPFCKEGRAEALNELQMVPADEADRAIDSEVRAQVHYWTSQAFKARGDAESAALQLDAARKIIESLAIRLPESTRDAVPQPA